eukprot:9971664-Alexandrium_andersonii.AAC.1
MHSWVIATQRPQSQHMPSTKAEPTPSAKHGSAAVPPTQAQRQRAAPAQSTNCSTSAAATLQPHNSSCSTTLSRHFAAAP